MNKLIGIILVVLTATYFIYEKLDADSPTVIKDNKPQIQDIGFINPPEINKELNNITPSDLEQFSRDTVVKVERGQRPNNLFTEEGQEYKTLGELMFGSRSRIENGLTNNPDLQAELKRVKYNLLLAKEIASLSKKVSIPDGKGGTMLDEKIMEQMSQLQMKLLVKAYPEKMRNNLR